MMIFFSVVKFPSLNFIFFFYLQVAVIAGNLDLANVIQRHKPDDVGKFLYYYLLNVKKKVSAADFLTRKIFAQWTY